MAQVRREVEITLRSINIPVTGTGLDSKTSHLVTADLLWPRTGVAKKSSAQPCTLADGRADFETVNWGRRVLFKEDVEGRFALGLTLTEALDDEAFEQFLRFFAGAVLSVGADAVENTARPFGKIAAAPISYAAKGIAKDTGPDLLVEGLAELDASDFPAGGERLLTLRMTTARRLVRVVRRSVGGKPRITRKLLIDKGEPNGEITLAVRVL